MFIPTELLASPIGNNMWIMYLRVSAKDIPNMQ